jgi:ribosomal protein S14
VRRVYPPPGFTCPYTDNCPHLDGLSTTWVFDEYQRADEVYHEHLEIIDILRLSLDAAQKKIQALEKENADISDIQKCGLSMRKTGYVKGIWLPRSKLRGILQIECRSGRNAIFSALHLSFYGLS